MDNDTKHTATPLLAKRTDSAHAVVFDNNGMLYAKMAGNEQAFERAEFIVRACNNHEPMVKALQGMLEAEDLPFLSSSGLMSRIDAARAALKQAEGD
jgi:hypothetical protein